MGSSSNSLSSRGNRSYRQSGEVASSENSESYKDRHSSHAGIERSRNRTYDPTSRSERVSRVLDTAADEASTKSGRSRTSGSTANHEDELERIRGIRARRMRQERLDRSDDGSRSPSRNESRRMEHRMRRRELREAKAHGETLSSPRQHRSTPAISRRELEDAGLVPRERTRRGDAQSKPNRVRSHRLTEVPPSRDDDGASMLSARRRRERNERISETGGDSRWDRAEDIDARLRARRARRNAAEVVTVASTSDASIEERPRRERLSLATDTLSEASGHSGISAGSGDPEFAGRRSERSCRSPPPRSRSVEEGITQNGTDTGVLDIEARRRERQQLRMKTVDARATDLTERLRVRREARAAERAISASSAQTALIEAEEMQLAAQHSPAKQGTPSEVDQSQPEILNTEESSETRTPPLTDRNERNQMFTESEEPPPASNKCLEGLEPDIFKSHDNSRWSLKLKVISAEDLPPYIVPSMPLCPFVKAGFVRLPSEPSDVREKLGRNSVDKIRSSHARSTTSKILSKRDSGHLNS